MPDDSLESFSRRIRLQANKVQPGADEAVRAAGRGVATELVESTPIDTGRAISNWDAKVGKVTSMVFREAAVPGYKGSTRQGTIAEALARMFRNINRYKAGEGKSLHIFNAAPYIRRLNEGWSKQAPAGFIEAAIQRGRAAIRNVRIFK